MTSNYKLKQDCKATLNSIRELLTQDERQKVEPHLRQILELTKGLVDNAKVSPEEHEALASEVGTLTKERTQLSETIAVLQRDLEQTSNLKAKITTLESDKHCLDETLIETICSGLVQAASLLNLVAYDDSAIAQWIIKKASSDEYDARQRRALLTVCLTLLNIHLSDETVSHLLTVFRSAAEKDCRTWAEDFSSFVDDALLQNSDSEQLSGDEWWWLAVNGASCAACFGQARAEDLEVTPVPEQLIGFRTRKKQLEIQQFLLTAQMDDVRRYMASLPAKIKSGEVASVRPRNPEPPTHGSTSWHLKQHKAV